jgi:AcrR family transcriptional regulator
MPNRAPDLVWEDPAAEPAEPGLRRAAIVRAAIGLADAEGLDAVSIRRVAAALGARPMSLYTHIASKEDLIALMLNEAVADVLLPEPLPEAWRDALREIAYRSYRAFLAHPWSLEALGRGQRIGPNLLRHGEQSAAAVAPLGLDRDDAWRVLRLVDAYTIGQAVTAANLDRVRDLPWPEPDPETHPNLAQTGFGERLPDPPDAFEVGLETVLDGVEHRFARR